MRANQCIRGAQDTKSSHIGSDQYLPAFSILIHLGENVSSLSLGHGGWGGLGREDVSSLFLGHK